MPTFVIQSENGKRKYGSYLKELFRNAFENARRNAAVHYLRGCYRCENNRYHERLPINSYLLNAQFVWCNLF